MPNDTIAVLTIVGMALVSYATRAGGLWLMSIVTPSPRVEAWLRSIPGAVLVALVAPTVLTSSLVLRRWLRWLPCLLRCVRRMYC